MPYCKCGCGKYIEFGLSNTYIHGHNRKGKRTSEETKRKLSKPRPRGSIEKQKATCKIKRIDRDKLRPKPKLCECGCGNYAKSNRRFVSGHNSRMRSEETCLKISLNNMGKPAWNKGIPSTKEARDKVSKTKKAQYLGEEGIVLKQSISEGLKKFFATEEGKASMRKQSKRLKGKPTPIKGKRMSDESRTKISERVREWWATASESEKKHKLSRLRNHDKPNRVEKMLLKLIKHLGFRFVGDGKFYIEKFNPDFVHKGKKMIVELFGRYWHEKDKRSRIEKKLRAFMNAGYQWLIVWDDDLLDDPNRQVKRIERKLLGLPCG